MLVGHAHLSVSIRLVIYQDGRCKVITSPGLKIVFSVSSGDSRCFVVLSVQQLLVFFYCKCGDENEVFHMSIMPMSFASSLSNNLQFCVLVSLPVSCVFCTLLNRCPYHTCSQAFRTVCKHLF
jgi:hypothetical protein